MLQNQNYEISTIAFHPDKPILANGSSNKTITFWNITT